MIGQRISNFQIVQELGAGGMGTVYKAKDIRLNRYVAIKMLHSHITNHSNVYKRFQNEAMISAQINHPHVTTLLDFIEVDGRSYLIMEYVDGSALDELLQSNGPLPEQRCIDICIQMLKGLSEAHQHHILHRDLKPGNIMVNKKGFVKIMDFGIAHISSATRITAQNKVIGTAEYIAPEIYLGKEPTKVSDLYSIGIILYEMLSGDVLFKAESEASLIYQVVNCKPKIKLLGVSPDLISIIKKLTDKNPSKRYRSTEELIDRLERIGGASKRSSNGPKFRISQIMEAFKMPALRVSPNAIWHKVLPEFKINGPIKFLISSLVFSAILMVLGSTLQDRNSQGGVNQVPELTDISHDSLIQRNRMSNSSASPSQQAITIELPNSEPIPAPKKEAKKIETETTDVEEHGDTKAKERPAPKKKKQTPQPVTIEIADTEPEKEIIEEKRPEPIAVSPTNVAHEVEEAKDRQEAEIVETSKPEPLRSKTVFINEQTIKIRFGSAISSSEAHEGQTIYLQAGQQIYVDGQILVNHGAPVKGRISKLKRKNNGKVHFGIQILAVQSVHSDWLALDYPEYSDIKRGDVVFPASILLSKVKLKSQQTQIFH